VQGTLLLIYRETETDTALDGLDPSKLGINGDGLQYDGNTVQNTYVTFQLSYSDVRGEDPGASWYSSFTDAEDSLDAVSATASDSDKQKAIVAANDLRASTEATPLGFDLYDL
jgi:hypothetical protein